MSDNDRARGNSFKLKMKIFRFALRKKFFIQRVMRHGHRLPRESCGHPLHGKVQGQVGQGFGLPALVEVVPVHGRGFGIR